MAAAKDKDWEPSVKAMLAFPDVLLMMSEKLEWTEKLGNGFPRQQKDVMTSVQRLRKKAQESGNLKTTKEQKVIVEKETKSDRSSSRQTLRWFMSRRIIRLWYTGLAYPGLSSPLPLLLLSWDWQPSPLPQAWL